MPTGAPSWKARRFSAQPSASTRPAPLVECDEVLDEPRALARVGPRDRERHLVRRMDPGPSDASERLELGPVAEPQLEPRRSEPKAVQGSDVRHESSRCGWPSAESSTMSRRKNRDTVQSVTTRTLRRNVGSA